MLPFLSSCLSTIHAIVGKRTELNVNAVLWAGAKCSEMYGRVVVASKVPLPNYRPDLDDKRPQREVCLLSSMARSCLTPISICLVFIIY